MIVDEARRAIHDALCVVRTLIKNNKIVYGGGSAEIAASIAVHDAADHVIFLFFYIKYHFLEQYRLLICHEIFC